MTVLCYVVELLDEDPMVDRIVCCRQIDECCTGNHTSLVIIFDMLSQVKQLAGALFSGAKTGLLYD